jgi:hypothetical protein
MYNTHKLMIDPEPTPLEAMKTEGYAMFDRVLPDRIWFERTYQLFDELVDGLTDESIEDLRAGAFAWLAVGDNDSYYCGVPSSFRDRKGLSGKRDKAYLQWCLEFARSPQFAATTAGQSPAMRELSERLEELESVCSRLYMDVLREIGAEHPEYLALHAEDRPLPIIIKMIRYNNSPEQFATDPHFDKSALSLILNADDDEVRWRVGRGRNCPLSSMFTPMEYPASAEEPNSCVMIPGLCLELAGVELPPTPHFVMPVVTGEHRHSIVAFLLVPHLQGTDGLSTQAPFVHDIMTNIV